MSKTEIQKLDKICFMDPDLVSGNVRCSHRSLGHGCGEGRNVSFDSLCRLRDFSYQTHLIPDHLKYLGV